MSVAAADCLSAAVILLFSNIFYSKSVPRPSDDPAWFCLHVGCDQRHEHVDPEALHRSFVMRVMAARSPNVRLQRAISRRNQELDATEMPPICVGEAAEDTDDEAEHGDGSRREGCGKDLAPRPERLSGPDQGGEGGAVQREEEGSDNAQDQNCTASKAGAIVPQREAPEGAGRGGGDEGDHGEDAVHDHAQEGDAGEEEPGSSRGRGSVPTSKMKKLNLACREVPSRYLAQLSTPNKITENSACSSYPNGVICLSETQGKVATTAAVKSVKRVHQPMSGKKVLCIHGVDQQRKCQGEFNDVTGSTFC